MRLKATELFKWGAGISTQWLGARVHTHDRDHDRRDWLAQQLWSSEPVP